MSRIVTLLGLIVALTGAITPLISTINSTVAFWLTIIGLAAAVVGRELVSPQAIKNFFGSKENRQFLLAGTMLIIVGSQVACGDVGGKIVRYADKGMRTVERLKEAKVIEATDADRILPLIRDVRAAGVVYNEAEQALKASKTEGEKQSKREQLRQAGQQVIDATRRLDSEGVLRIKNEQARTRLQQGLALAEIVLDLVN
jgi:hypothetical protein